MKHLNLGCGYHFHPAWTNVDFLSTGQGVIAHNLLEGIPFDDNSFEVVYHSHVLEHFSKAGGKIFIKECYRVLKRRGIIRIAVPDLETITSNYIEKLKKAKLGDRQAANDYNWIKLELYDQTVRNCSGGGMKEYLFQESIPNEDYVFSRIGLEGKKLRQSYFAIKDKKVGSVSKPTFSLKKYFSLTRYKNRLKNMFLSDLEKKALQIGLFRLGGEIHQWMYDEFSLGLLLSDVGFSEIKVFTADTSQIPNWNDYQLDVVEGDVRKPDSLFMEALKL